MCLMRRENGRPQLTLSMKIKKKKSSKCQTLEFFVTSSVRHMCGNSLSSRNMAWNHIYTVRAPHAPTVTDNACTPSSTITQSAVIKQFYSIAAYGRLNAAKALSFGYDGNINFLWHMEFSFLQFSPMRRKKYHRRLKRRKSSIERRERRRLQNM